MRVSPHPDEGKMSMRACDRERIVGRVRSGREFIARRKGWAVLSMLNRARYGSRGAMGAAEFCWHAVRTYTLNAISLQAARG